MRVAILRLRPATPLVSGWLAGVERINRKMDFVPPVSRVAVARRVMGLRGCAIRNGLNCSSDFLHPRDEVLMVGRQNETTAAGIEVRLLDAFLPPDQDARDADVDQARGPMGNSSPVWMRATSCPR